MTDYSARHPRTVKPRKAVSNADRPILAVIDDTACDESGETMSTEDLILSLRRKVPSIIVTANESAWLVRRTQYVYGRSPNFNFRVAPVEREIFTGKNKPGRRLTMSVTSVSYLGWQNEKRGRGNTVRNRYHFVIDPLTFSGMWLPDRTLGAYVEWMTEVRDFCIKQKWNLRPTQGSTARQGLVDERFYPEPRRKVPRATNDRVRPQLPGNHYQLAEGTSGREYEADYLDQTRCHHQHAVIAKLPDANHLNGYGYFRNPESAPRPWKSDPERIAQFLNGFMGMCYGQLYWKPSKRKVTKFIPKYLQEWKVNEPSYFFTEDLILLQSLGVEIRSIIAAWGGKKEDTGLTKYGKWALRELEDSAPLWKKTLLLSAYGTLATRPRKHAVAFHQSKGGTRTVLRSKSRIELPVNLHTAAKVTEPSTNNVLHRALIEASNRAETLLFARALESDGYSVLCIYVDALIVESDSNLPPVMLPYPWRLDRHLTHLRFLSDTQFASSQMVKLPGITGAELRKEVARGSLGVSNSGKDMSNIRLMAYEAWVNRREHKRHKSPLDDMTPEERWEIFRQAGRPVPEAPRESASIAPAPVSETPSEQLTLAPL